MWLGLSGQEGSKPSCEMSLLSLCIPNSDNYCRFPAVNGAYVKKLIRNKPLDYTSSYSFSFISIQLLKRIFLTDLLNISSKRQ